MRTDTRSPDASLGMTPKTRTEFPKTTCLAVTAAVGRRLTVKRSDERRLHSVVVTHQAEGHRRFLL
jgi:hypothetical protein